MIFSTRTYELIHGFFDTENKEYFYKTSYMMLNQSKYVYTNIYSDNINTYIVNEGNLFFLQTYVNDNFIKLQPYLTE